GSLDDHLYCLDADTGELIWKHGTGDELRSSPAVVDGKVYIASLENRIYCLDTETGKLIWRYEAGELTWWHETGYLLRSSPAVADGKVYIGCFYLYCLDAETGKLISRDYSFGLSIISSSPALANGKVYVGSCDDSIYCFGGKEISEILTPTETFSPLSTQSIHFIHIWLFSAAVTSIIMVYMINRFLLKKTSRIPLDENMSYGKYELASRKIIKMRYTKFMVIALLCYMFIVLFASFFFGYEMIGKSTLTADPKVDPLIEEFYNARVKTYSVFASLIGFIGVVVFLVLVKAADLIFDFLKSNVISNYFLKSWRAKKDYVLLNVTLENSVVPKISRCLLIYLVIATLVSELLVHVVNEVTFFVLVGGSAVILCFVLLLINNVNLIRIGLSKRMTPARLRNLLRAENLEIIVGVFFILLIVLPSFLSFSLLAISLINEGISADNALHENFVNDFQLIIAGDKLNNPPWYLWAISEEIGYFDPKPPLNALEFGHLSELAISLGLMFVLCLGAGYAISVLYVKGIRAVYSIVISFSLGIFLTRVIYWYVSWLSFANLSSWIAGAILAFITFLLKKWIDSMLEGFEKGFARGKDK
ncbi:MAG: PQQ-binding-like beta-propeller repeat protein, partial [Candidatus Methanofastidiosia archaeon]